MNEKEILKLIRGYANAWPNTTQKLTAAGAAIYARALSDIDAGTVNAALTVLLQTSKFFPSVAEIRETASSFSRLGFPTAGEAWQEIEEQARINFLDRPWQFSHDFVREAVERFGKYELCTLSESGVGAARAQFSKIYTEIVNDFTERKNREAALQSSGGMLRLLN